MCIVPPPGHSVNGSALTPHLNRGFCRLLGDRWLSKSDQRQGWPDAEDGFVQRILPLQRELKANRELIAGLRDRVKDLEHALAFSEDRLLQQKLPTNAVS